MATKVDLRERAGAKLGLATERTALSAWQAARIDEVIDEEQAFLEGEGIAYWDLTDIPEAAMRGYVDLIAGRAAPRVKGAENASPYTALVDIGLTALRRYTATRGTERATRHRFF